MKVGRSPNGQVMRGLLRRRRKKAPDRLRNQVLKVSAACYSPTGEPRSTFADEALHFRVRNGNGCFILSKITGKTKNVSESNARTPYGAMLLNEVITASLWAISIGQLNALLHLHLQPIKVVVFNLPSPPKWGKSCLWGGLALRCFQRLSVPHIATRRVPLA